jgi:predicted acyltransferase
MEQKNNRLKSIDTLRGFDMLWIMGGAGLVGSLYGVLGGQPFGWLNEQMEHVPWNGFHFMDLIFPLFLFIAGLSFPFSLAKKREMQVKNAQIIPGLIKRAVTLVILGIIYNGFLQLDFPHIRYASVLSHIGLGWFFGALICLYSRKMMTMVYWIVVILIGYGALNLLVLSPEATGSNPFVPENNIVCQFDRWFLPGALYNGNFDPEGILSVIPAIATALIGMTAGRYLQQNTTDSPSRKSGMYLLAGVSLVVLAFVFSFIIPINKALWSSSFVLLTGGIGLLLFALFYWIIDVRKKDGWTLFFRVIGMNSITIYMAQTIVNFHGIGEFFLGGVASKLPEGYNSLLLHLAYIAVCWLFLYFLYRKKIFLKV